MTGGSTGDGLPSTGDEPPSNVVERRGKRFRVVRMTEIPAVPCPCGTSRRAFADGAPSCAGKAGLASLHIVDICEDSRTHYHERRTEIYFVLEGEGAVELDGEKIPVSPGMAVWIDPGCRHRPVGRLRLLNVVIPAFEEKDEHFDEVRDEEDGERASR